jgi:Fur family ferric uptake transcriptional regulator
MYASAGPGAQPLDVVSSINSRMIDAQRGLDAGAMTPACAIFRQKLRQLGLKYTPERARILDAVLAVSRPFQADELLTMLNSPRSHAAPGGAGRVSKATVYRTLKLMTDSGLLSRELLDAEQAHYRVTLGKRSSGLLYRTDTHEVDEVDLPELTQIRDRLCRSRGLEPSNHRFVIYATSAADRPHLRTT